MGIKKYGNKSNSVIGQGKFDNHVLSTKQTDNESFPRKSGGIRKKT